MLELVQRARAKRWVNVFVVCVRILIGFAFLPAALKKVLDQPFTDPANTGRFHDFLDGFYATGWFYNFVGVMQLLASFLLFTQLHATLGALIALPILTAITVFCWSTGVYPTASIATMMLLGTIGLVLWDIAKWRGIFVRDDRAAELHVAQVTARIDLGLWARCGLAMFVLYLGSAIALGGVYRPRGIELDEPGFYVMPAMLLLPLVTFVLDRRRTHTRPQ